MRPSMLAVAGVLAGLSACGQAQPIAYTSTREVTCLAASKDGTLWAGTTGGILRRSSNGRWQKYTRLDGLPSNEVQAIGIDTEGNPRVDFPTESAVWEEGQWKRYPTLSGLGQYGESHAVWNGWECDGYADGLSLAKGCARIVLPLPKGPGTHISALLADGPRLLAGFYGAGIYSTDGRTWWAVESDLPAAAREITALERCNGELWVGTRREGLWHRSKGKWVQQLQPDEPYFHNAQAICRFRDSIFVSTLEDGLMQYQSGHWIRVESISSSAPRQMCEFQCKLYIRHGNGKVDCFDGAAWSKDVFHDLPRKEITALAADSNHLYVSQWGGWSELTTGVRAGGHTAAGPHAEDFRPTLDPTASAAWTHHLKLEALQGKQTTCLLPDGDRLWIGTQGGGVFEYSRTTGELRQHAEPNGLLDDWVTSLAKCGRHIYAGTFAGSLSCWAGNRWKAAVSELGPSVTSLALDGRDGLFAVAHSGIWYLGSGGKVTRPFPNLDSEAQSICGTPSGIWVGARTGIYFLPR